MSGRKSSIAGLLITTAGAAAALGLFRVATAGISPGELWDAIVHPKGGWSLRHTVEISLELGPFLGVPLLAGWTPACLALSLLAPRSPWRKLRREPGFVGCLLATAVVAVTLVAVVACLALSVLEYQGRVDTFFIPIILCGCLTGGAIVASWATMLITGTWRPNASLIDRLGRLTGSAWIMLAGLCMDYISLSIR